MFIGTVFGTRIRLSAYFLLLLVLFGFANLLPQALTTFSLVFLHELAHILTARGLGLKVSEIELLPFGGVARVDAVLALNPGTEITVALAGPLSSAVIGLSLTAIHIYGLVGEHHLVAYSLQGAWLLAGFNLVPAFPLDGGRVLRALLVRQKGFRRATQVAVWCSRVCAVLIIGGSFYALSQGYANYNLFIIAFFILISANSERALGAYAFLRYLLRKKEELHGQGVIPVEHLLAEADTSLIQILSHFIPQRYHLITVVSQPNLKPLGTTTESAVVSAFLDEGTNLKISELL